MSNYKFNFNNQNLFSLDEMTDVLPDDKFKILKRFKGVAYDGGIIDREYVFDYWADKVAKGIVFDLASLNIEKSTNKALLYDHDSELENICGMIHTVKNEDNKLTVYGDVYDIEAGAYITKLYNTANSENKNFPFGMSVCIVPDTVEFIADGESKEVNGQVFSGPIVIYRNAVIHEYTITVTPACENTSINLFKNQFKNKTITENFSMSTEKDKVVENQSSQVLETLSKTVEALANRVESLFAHKTTETKKVVEEVKQDEVATNFNLDSVKLQFANEALSVENSKLKEEIESLKHEISSLNEIKFAQRQDKIKSIFTNAGIENLSDDQLRQYIHLDDATYKFTISELEKISDSFKAKHKSADDILTKSDFSFKTEPQKSEFSITENPLIQSAKKLGIA